MNIHKHYSLAELTVASASTLSTFINRSTIPSPRFGLFDVVILVWQREDGNVTNDVVQILGFVWCPKYARDPGWWYHIRYLEKPIADGHLSAGHQEDCHEDELSTLTLSRAF